jgi:ParB family chromosome partitioning protein
MEKKGLGKGLEALIADNLSEDGSNVLELEIDKIAPNPFQPRQHFDDEKMAELTQSVQVNGILQPILLRKIGKERYEIIAGERRFRAAKRSGFHKVPVIIRECVDEQALEYALIENVQREDINPLEAAHAYKRLVDEFGMTQQEVARKVGKSQPAIANALRLLSLPEQILTSLQKGDITEGHARSLLQISPDSQLSAWRKTIQKKLSVRDVERMARELKENDPVEKEIRIAEERMDRNDPNLAAIEEALQLALGTRVRVRKSGGSGKIEIEFYSEEELEGIIERILGNDKG